MPQTLPLIIYDVRDGARENALTELPTHTGADEESCWGRIRNHRFPIDAHGRRVATVTPLLWDKVDNRARVAGRFDDQKGGVRPLEPQIAETSGGMVCAHNWTLFDLLQVDRGRMGGSLAIMCGTLELLCLNGGVTMSGKTRYNLLKPDTYAQIEICDDLKLSVMYSSWVLSTSTYIFRMNTPRNYQIRGQNMSKSILEEEWSKLFL